MAYICLDSNFIVLLNTIHNIKQICNSEMVHIIVHSPK